MYDEKEILFIKKELSVFKNIVRVGTVSSVDIENRTVRVIFADKKDSDGKPFISGALKVVQNMPFISFQETENHTHDLKINPWLPFLNQRVLCLYFCLSNGENEGFIIGGL